jgi:hypothetical protein
LNGQPLPFFLVKLRSANANPVAEPGSTPKQEDAMFHAPKLPILALCSAAALTLAGCGHSDKADEAASADNVEMPAEESMSGLPGSAVPQADPSATATDQPAGADASASAADSAAEAASGPAPDEPVAAPPAAQQSPSAPIHM